MYTLYFCFVFRFQTALHITAHAFDSSCCNYTFRCTAGTHHHINAFRTKAGSNNRRHVTIGNKFASSTQFTSSLYNMLMAFAFQHNNCQLTWVFAQCCCYTYHIFFRCFIDINSTFCFWANYDFFHVHIRCM